MARILPKLATKLCFGHSAWIVGSGARDQNPKDYDIAVPFSHWASAQLLIPPEAQPNSFGGWKCLSEGKEIDVWPCELGELMVNNQVTHLWHPKSGVRYERVL